MTQGNKIKEQNHTKRTNEHMTNQNTSERRQMID